MRNPDSLPMGETVGPFTRYASGYVYRTGAGGEQSRVVGVWNFRKGCFVREDAPDLCRAFERRVRGEVET